MGRTKHKSAKATAKAAPEPEPSSSTTPAAEPTVESLLEKTVVLLAQQDYPLALRFADRILSLSPTHADARLYRALSLLETCEPEKAALDFEGLAQCGEREREVEARLYLAQLREEAEAMTWYERAVEGLEGLLGEVMDARNRGEEGAEEREKEVRRKMTGALVAMAELFLTDMCFHPDAQTSSLALLQRALSLDPTDPDIHTTLCSHSISSCAPPSVCLSHAQTGWDLWRALPAGDPGLPPTSSRRSLAKVLVELRERESAQEVLKGVLAEDEGDVEAWYLMGWVGWMVGEEVQGEEEKREAWTEAREYLDMALQYYHQTEHFDPPLLQHTQELITQLQAAGIQSRPADEDDLEDGDGEEEGWTSDEDGMEVDGS